LVCSTLTVVRCSRVWSRPHWTSGGNYYTLSQERLFPDKPTAGLRHLRILLTNKSRKLWIFSQSTASNKTTLLSAGSDFTLQRLVFGLSEEWDPLLGAWLRGVFLTLLRIWESVEVTHSTNHGGITPAHFRIQLRSTLRSSYPGLTEISDAFSLFRWLQSYPGRDWIDLSIDHVQSFSEPCQEIFFS